MQEKRLKGNGKICYALVDLFKACGRVTSVGLKGKKNKTSERLIPLEMYKGSMTRVSASGGITPRIDIKAILICISNRYNNTPYSDRKDMGAALCR